MLLQLLFCSCSVHPSIYPFIKKLSTPTWKYCLMWADKALRKLKLGGLVTILVLNGKKIRKLRLLSLSNFSNVVVVNTSRVQYYFLHVQLKQTSTFLFNIILSWAFQLFIYLRYLYKSWIGRKESEFFPFNWYLNLFHTRFNMGAIWHTTTAASKQLGKRVSR